LANVGELFFERENGMDQHHPPRVNYQGRDIFGRVELIDGFGDHRGFESVRVGIETATARPPAFAT
jgi:hypothetical protein